MSSQGHSPLGTTTFWWVVTVLASTGFLWVCTAKFMGEGKLRSESGQTRGSDAAVEQAARETGRLAARQIPPLPASLAARKPALAGSMTNQVLKGNIPW